jgi:hypothetical protein
MEEIEDTVNGQGSDDEPQVALEADDSRERERAHHERLDNQRRLSGEHRPPPVLAL